jgi:hypothetical protein
MSARAVAMTLVALALVLAVAVGCGPKPTQPAAPASGDQIGNGKTSAKNPATKTGGADEAMSAPTADTGEKKLVVREPQNAAPAAPEPFGWSAMPAVQTIPASPIEGTIQGKPFRPTKVVVERENGKASAIRLVVTEDLDSAKAGDLIDVVLLLGSGAGAGEIWTKAFDADPGDASAYYRYVDDNETVSTQQSSWSCALTVRGGLAAVAPGTKVTGQLWLCFGDDAKSFLGGTFDASVAE